MKTINDLKTEWNEVNKLKIFEIEVINLKTKETDYLIFQIELIKNSLYAWHEPLTHKEEKSKKIAYKKVVLDKCFSLDVHLQDLYSECVDAICSSDFYSLN
jgi:hypothetical protein